MTRRSCSNKPFSFKSDNSDQQTTDTLYTMKELAAVYMSRERYGDAELMLKRVLSVRMKKSLVRNTPIRLSRCTSSLMSTSNNTVMMMLRSYSHKSCWGRRKSMDRGTLKRS